MLRGSAKIAGDHPSLILVVGEAALEDAAEAGEPGLGAEALGSAWPRRRRGGDAGYSSASSAAR